MASLWRMRSKQISRPDMIGFSAIFTIFAATFLMIIMTIPQPQYGIAADLPKTSSAATMPAAARMDALTVWVLRDGTVYAFGDRARPNGLADMIRERLKQGANKKVFIKADARAPYSAVAEVIDGVRDAGIQNVAFIVDPRKSAAP